MCSSGEAVQNCPVWGEGIPVQSLSLMGSNPRLLSAHSPRFVSDATFFGDQKPTKSLDITLSNPGRLNHSRVIAFKIVIYFTALD